MYRIMFVSLNRAIVKHQVAGSNLHRALTIRNTEFVPNLANILLRPCGPTLLNDNTALLTSFRVANDNEALAAPRLCYRHCYPSFPIYGCDHVLDLTLRQAY